MTGIPVNQPPTDQQGQAPRTTQRREPGRFRTLPAASIEAAISIAVGVALGLVDLSSTEALGMLRFSALIASLLLVGDGVTSLAASIRAPEPAPATRRGDAAEEGQQAGPQIQVPGAADDDLEQAQQSRTGALLVLGLATWLGLSVLAAYPTAPLTLILLGMLSAYLLFSKGLQMLRQPVVAGD